MAVEKKDIRQNLIQYYFQHFPGEAAEILNEASTEEILSYLRKNPLNISGDILMKLNNTTTQATSKQIRQGNKRNFDISSGFSWVFNGYENYIFLSGKYC